MLLSTCQTESQHSFEVFRLLAKCEVHCTMQSRIIEYVCEDFFYLFIYLIY